jgi:hypothetical protein
MHRIRAAPKIKGSVMELNTILEYISVKMKTRLNYRNYKFYLLFCMGVKHGA